jgi:adenylate cyclase
MTVAIFTRRAGGRHGCALRTPRRARTTRWRTRRPGIFEGLPRRLYLRTGARYLEGCAWGAVINGVVVSGFGVIVVGLYVDVGAMALALFAACSALGFAVEGALASLYLLRMARPARSWLAGWSGEDALPDAWVAAAQLPVALLRRPSLYAIGAACAGGADLVLAWLLGLPAYQAAWLFPMSYLLYLSLVVLRYVALELAMRPLLEDIVQTLPQVPSADSPRVSLHQRLLATVPMVTWGAALTVSGLLTERHRDLSTIGIASLVALGVTAGFAIWLSLVLGDSVSGPIIDLRDATQRLAGGDLDLRVPVVSTDEVGELAAAFNQMVLGLGEREQLRKAFGMFVDPGLVDRVLTEGTDLRGEEIEASVLFLDVRGFTEFAQRAAAPEVVACLNALYDVVIPVIERHGGHANKFIGDGLLAVFGAPERHPDHAARAVAAAREITRLVDQGIRGELRVGVGVNSGRVLVGTIGGGGRRDFTVIGDPVNTAARVEAATRLTGDDLLITETTLHALGQPAAEFEARSSVTLKGKPQPMSLYAPRGEAATTDG